MTRSVYVALFTVSVALAALITDPNDPRVWQSATIGTFADLIYGQDTAVNRQLLITNQMLDDGVLTADLSQTGTLVPTSWAQTYAGCFGYSYNSDPYGYTCSAGGSIYDLANNIDQYWFQSSNVVGNTVWDLGVDAPQAGIFITVDHGPLPLEAIESTHYLGPTPTGPWTQTEVVRVYLQGYLADTSNTNLFDGFTYVVRHPTSSSFRYISAIHGGDGALQSDGDDEINGVVALDLDFNPIRPPFNICINFAAYSVSGVQTQFKPLLLSGRWTANAVLNYAYSLTTRSFGSRGTPTPQSNTLVVFFSQDYQNLFNFNMLLDSNDGSAGSATVRITTKYFGSASIQVFDDPAGSATANGDPADTYQWFPSTGVGEFTWSWGATTTDGLSLGPIPVNVTNALTITIEVISSTGLSQIVVMSEGAPSITYPIDQPLFIRRESCSCGNNVLNPFEECDGQSCCKDCHIQSSGVICRPKNGTCDLVEYCDGANPTCPPDTFLPEEDCQCPPGRRGSPACDQPICDYYTNCSSCNAWPQCGWCCESQHCSSGTVASPTTGSCSTWQYGSCDCSPTCSSGGQCQCGKCVCDVGRTGITCSEYLGCDGIAYTSPDQLPPVDVCGICKGDNTSCLGCDGVPFGLSYDHCGVCGGDGSSCVEICPGKTCEDCLSNGPFTKEGVTGNCQWCKGEGKCIDDLHFYDCGTILTEKSTCDDILGNLNAEEVAGLGAGIIAAIVIGVAAAVILAGLAGKKGYDAYMKHRNDMSGANSNPMYRDGGRTGVNPFYEMEAR